ncbi:hepcidin-1 [Lampris incognitus]|uniref:hepcidin-1 n=1 Tax=Lampris incognitus TaxID=2546036 RepID=UPI0024B5E843|nr:hepcidin-1 [Lampris incognitus]
MKAFSIAVAVTLVLAFICILEISAGPSTGVREPEEAESNDTPAAEHHQMSAGSWMIPARSRQKRMSHLSLCQVCCNCCPGQSGCGFCCKF